MTNLTIAKRKNLHKHPLLSPLLTGGLLLTFLCIQGLLFILNFNTRILGITNDLDVSQIVLLTNAEREKAGLKPLQINEKLNKAALEKANDMFQFGYWDHFSPSKRPPWNFMLDNGYDYHYAGENLAKDFYSNDKLVEAWMASPPHRANLLSGDYEDIGIAVVSGNFNGKETVFIVMMLGTPFRPEDYNIVDYKTQLTPQEATTPLLEASQFSLANITSNTFLLTKALALGILLLLLVFIGIDLAKSSKLLTFKKISKKYWGHLVFLLAISVLIWATKNSTSS